MTCLVVRQITIAGPSWKTIRPDLVLFVNGLPLVVIELKDPTEPVAIRTHGLPVPISV